MPPQQPANDNKVSPLAWLFFFFAILCDLAKILCFLLQLVPVVGIELSIILSFYLSVVENIVVFGGLWFTGLYKSPKGQMFNLLTTFGVVTINLVPEVDDFPFTSITVFFMIMKAYAQSKLGSAIGVAALAAATGGAGLLAEGAVVAGGAAEAGAAAEASGAARAAQAARTAQQAARAASRITNQAAYKERENQPANEEGDEE